MHNNVIINEEILNVISQKDYDKMVCVASASEIAKKNVKDDIESILKEFGY